MDILKSKKGFTAPLIFVIFILISIPIGIYLALHPQIWKPKAYNVPANTLVKENPQNVQQAVDFLQTNLDSVEEKALINDLDAVAMEDSTTKQEGDTSYRNSTLEDKLKKLREIFNIPIIVPDDQVENYAKSRLEQGGLTVEGSLLDQYDVTIPDDCYAPFDSATGTYVPPVCSLNIEQFSQYGQEILDLLVGDFVEIYKSFKNLSALTDQIKQLMIDSGSVSRSSLDPEQLYKKYRFQSIYNGKGNNSWGLAIQEILNQDLSNNPDESLTSDQAQFRHQLSEKLQDYLQKSQKLNKDVQMVTFLDMVPSEKIARITSPIYKPLARYLERTVKPLSKNVKASVNKIIDKWLFGKVDLKALQTLINEKAYMVQLSVVHVPRPNKSNAIDAVKAEQWIDAHPQGVARDMAQAIINETKHVSQEEFELALANSVKRFNKSLIGEEYAMFVIPGKSNGWVTELALPEVSYLPAQVYDLNLIVDTEELNLGSIRRLVFFDDGIYTAAQLVNYIGSIRLAIRHSKIDANEVTIDIVVPYVTDWGKENMNRNFSNKFRNVNFYESETLPSATSLLTKYGANIVGLANKVYGLMDRKALIYFDHKVPDLSSTIFGYSGIVFNQAGKEVLDTSGKPLEIRFIPDTVTPYSSNTNYSY